MDFNGNFLTGDLSNGGVVNGTLEVNNDLFVNDSISLTGKYTLPTTAPTGPNEVIVSDGTQQLIWGGDLSVGDVSSATGISVNNEMVLYNGITGKSIKNSGVIVNTGIINNAGIVMTNAANDANSSVVLFKKQRAIFPVSAGDQLGKLQFDALGGSGYIETAHIRCRAVGDITGSNFGTQMYFSVTNEGGSLNNKLLIWDDGTQVFDSLISPNLYCGADKGVSMYLDGDGDKIDIKDKNDNKIVSFQSDGLYIEKDLIINNAGVPDIRIVSDGSSGLSMIDINNSNEYFLSIGPDYFSKYVYQNNQNGLRISSVRGRGTTFSTRAGLLEFDRISEITNAGTDSTGVQGPASGYYVSCTEDWTAGSHGTKVQIKTTDNGNITPLVKLEIGTGGVTVKNNLTIGQIGTEYVHPSTRGTTGQYLKLNGSNMEWTNEVLAPERGGIVFSQTVNKNVSNTNVETSLIGAGTGTLSIVANTLQVGSVIRFTSRGQGDLDGNDILNMRSKLGTTLLTNISNGTTTMGPNQEWEYNFIGVVRTVGVTGSISCYANLRYNIEATLREFDTSTLVPVTIDTTLTQSFVNTIQFGKISLTSAWISLISNLDLSYTLPLSSSPPIVLGNRTLHQEVVTTGLNFPLANVETVVMTTGAPIQTSLLDAGVKIVAYVSGVVSTAGAGTWVLSLRLKFCNLTATLPVLIPNLATTSQGIRAKIEVTIRTNGITGTTYCAGDFGFNTDSGLYATGNDQIGFPGIDTTSTTNNLEVTAQFNGSPAGLSFFLRGGEIVIHNVV